MGEMRMDHNGGKWFNILEMRKGKGEIYMPLAKIADLHSSTEEGGTVKMSLYRGSGVVVDIFIRISGTGNRGIAIHTIEYRFESVPCG